MMDWAVSVAEQEKGLTTCAMLTLHTTIAKLKYKKTLCSS